MDETLEALTRQMELADQLLAGRERMVEPQDLPGRFGRVIKSVDHVLAAVGRESVLAGDWAVWRHGFHGRMTQDVDIALAADRVDEFLRSPPSVGSTCCRYSQGAGRSWAAMGATSSN
jgi:hypothetical protein